MTDEKSLGARLSALLTWAWLLVLALGIGSCVWKAHAAECASWGVSRWYDWDQGRWHHRRFCRRWIDDEAYYRRHDPRPEHAERAPEVAGYERRVERIEDKIGTRGECYPRSYTGVSDEHKSVDNAKADAIRQWRKTVSWHGGGGEFMDYDIAVGRWFRCGPSSAGDSWSGRLSRGATKAFSAATGSTAVNIEGLSVRCEVTARPCRARAEYDRGQAPEQP